MFKVSSMWSGAVRSYKINLSIVYLSNLFITLEIEITY